MYPKSARSLVSIEAIAKVFDFADMCHARFGAIYFKEQFSLNIWHYVV